MESSTLETPTYYFMYVVFAILCPKFTWKHKVYHAENWGGFKPQTSPLSQHALITFMHPLGVPVKFNKEFIAVFVIHLQVKTHACTHTQTSFSQQL